MLPRYLCCFSASISHAGLYALGLSYYCYLTFLGYSALPFLERTEVGRGAGRRGAGGDSTALPQAH